MRHFRAQGRSWLRAAIFYALLSVLATWPVAPRLTSHLPHDVGDPVLGLTLLQWNATTRWFTPTWWDGVGFYPLADTLTLTDPRLGPALISTPIIWLTGSAIAGYNTAFILSFFFSALAAHALAFTLTRSHLAGLVAGCAFGFAPYRASRLAQIELLGAYWMPIGLLALHRWIDTRQWPWLALLAGALTAQGLFCAYYLPMFAVLVGCWLLWFARPGDLVRAGVAGLVGIAPLVPLFLYYARAHHRLGLYRGIAEIEKYSADVSGLWARAPELAFWPSAALENPEGYLFPGLSIAVLAAIYALRGRARPPDAPRMRLARRTLILVAAAAFVVGSVPVLFGPWRLEIGALTLSLSTFRKPLSVAIGALMVAGALHPRVVGARRSKSVFGFYVLAAALMFVLALGPSPTAFGVPIIYKGPYAWLMLAPGFDTSLRVPARFAMLMVLALSVAAALAWHHFSRRWPPRAAGWATAMFVGLIVAEGWSAPMTTVMAPSAFAWPAQCEALPRLELPIGSFGSDAAAEHRALLAGVRSVNGLSGFVAPHVLEFTVAARARDNGALNALAEVGPLCIAVNRSADGGDEMFRWVRGHPYTAPLGVAAPHEFLMLKKVRPRPRRVAGERLPIAAATSHTGAVDVAVLTDRDRATAWQIQEAGDPATYLTITLGCRAALRSIGVSHGGGRVARAMAIDVSSDEATWRTAWRGRPGGAAVRAALREPRTGEIHFRARGTDVRQVRLRALRLNGKAGWSVADIEARGRCLPDAP